MRIIDSPDEPPSFDLQALLAPRSYVARLYVTRGLGLAPSGEGEAGGADPYLKVRGRDHVTRWPVPPYYMP